MWHGLEQSVTIAGLLFELTGVLIITRDVFRARKLDGMIKATTARKDEMFAGSMPEAAGIHSLHATAETTIATLFAAVEKLILAGPQAAQVPSDLIQAFSQLVADFQTQTNRNKADAATLLTGYTKLVEQLKERNNLFRKLADDIDRTWLHAVKFGLVLVVIGTALEIAGQVMSLAS
jgi:hypothetical protein